MKALTVQQHADHVIMILNNTHGFYRYMQQAFSDKYENRIKLPALNKRLELLTADVTGFTYVHEFTDKSELSGDTAAVQRLVFKYLCEGYKEYVNFRKNEKGK